MHPSILSASLLSRYDQVRKASEQLCEPLAIEDFVAQSMPDVSPTKWHLAHTSWFFETFLLKPFLPGYSSPDPRYEVLFNSYYNAVGQQYPRPQRGLITRPTVDQVMGYRKRVDDGIRQLIDLEGEDNPQIAERVELGIQHEQQHQELMLMDIKHVFSHNPLYPMYAPRQADTQGNPNAIRWRSFTAEPWMIGASAEGFRYDNETPRHSVQLCDFSIAGRLITNAEYKEFIDDGGYETPELWLSDGWAQVRQEGWRAPLYWVGDGDSWQEFTLNGLIELEPCAPVCHVSFYEADAFASWAGYRLPTEAEWERVSNGLPLTGQFVESGNYHPRRAPGDRDHAEQMFGDVWEWTRSAYQPYPGFKPAAGALGEYNGKFMCNQMVLKGGCCATPQSHIRASYRNFFYPHQRWMFSGIRLAK